jgi:hypothetical protein
MGRTLLLLAVIAAPWILVAAADQASSSSADLQRLYDQRDFFALRDSLERLPDLKTGSAELRFFKAATQQAFNQPAAANETIRSLLTEHGLEAGLFLQLRNLQLTNHLRLHRYGAALEAAEAILSELPANSGSPVGSEVRGKLPLLQALANVPPQETEIRGPIRLALGQTRRVPLKIQGTEYAFALDTGANFSVIMRSEAQKLGLEIQPVDLVISTSTAHTVTGDVTVARDVEIGKIRYRNVVFLVLPDESLSFPDGQQIPGLVGFPLVDAMGEVRFRRDDVMEVPHKPQRRPQQNLALNGLEPLVQVRYGKDNLLCRLDTGASQTVFYEPFFRRYQERIESSGHRITAEATGVGGTQEIPAYRLPRVALTIASAGVNLRRVEVYTRPIRPPEENYLDCNVGLDAFAKFRSYTINFRDMSLVLN